MLCLTLLSIAGTDYSSGAAIENGGFGAGAGGGLWNRGRRRSLEQGQEEVFGVGAGGGFWVRGRRRSLG